LVNRIFGKDGVIVVDGDDSSFKALFSPHIKNELINKLVDSEITNTNIRLNKIDKNFKIQVNPRPINLFYIKDGLRERIIQKQDLFRVLNTDLSFNLESILIELEKHPERFSPNVIMRPLFQECILPNLSYTGGGSELSYWLQLKSYFDISKVCFPILMHRNSAVITTTKQIHKLDKLDLSISDLFLSREDLITKITKLKSSQKIDFSSQITHLRKQFNKLYDLAKETDASFTGAVAAQEKKQINGLLYLEKRLLKAEKKKYKSSIEQALILQSLLFPSGNLQERLLNFTTFYAFHGEKFIKKLKSEMNPFQNSFSIISL
jgi:bacillithiol biosynthesis cysteine-adding enzyme BshC